MGIKQDFFYIFLLLLRQFFSLKKHCIPFNGIDRGLKLMRNIGDKIHLQYFCCTKLFCHHIKTLVRFSNFCDTAVRFQVLFKISLRNFLHCFTESGNWFQQPCIDKGSNQPCNQCIKNQKPAKHRYAARQIKKMIQKSK